MTEMHCQLQDSQ